MSKKPCTLSENCIADKSIFSTDDLGDSAEE